MRVAGSRWSVVLALLAASACARSSDEDDQENGDAGRSADGTTPGFDDGEDGGVRTLTALTIAPATSTLTVNDPKAPPTETLQAIGTFPDKKTAPVSASWHVDRLDIASVGGGTGVITPSGATFGIVTVTAAAGGQTATATCSGFCRDTGNGPVCVDNPGGCAQVGEHCTTAADCRNAGPGIACTAGICQETGPR